MKRSILYVHGKGGTADEADHYRSLCPGYEVFGLDYKGYTPWDTREEILAAYEDLARDGGRVSLIANSIGAFFAMDALQGKPMEAAFFVSPIVNMEKLILDMMVWAKVTQPRLQELGTVETNFGETLSWEYLCYVRSHPIHWTAPTWLLYARKDYLTPFEEVEAFVRSTGAALTVMENGEHWFHTPEQMAFLDRWLLSALDGKEKGCS